MKVFKCTKCGNMISYLNKDACDVKCCGEAMVELVPNTTDAAGEKHVPVIEIDGNTVISISDKIPTHKMYVNGIIDVEIEGINEPCVGYFWTTYDKKIYWEGKAYDFWEQRGLVCLKSDEEGCKDAKTRYDLKYKFL